jgi:Rha family phage regulatory protein
MTNLAVINKEGQFVVDSRDVAEMTDIRHDDLLKKIRAYAEILDDSAKLPSQEFFIESTYQNSQNKTQPCYLLTKKGCDMVANKMTGEKGVLFTATYVTKFEEMEKQTQLQQFKIPKTYIEALRLSADLEEERQRLESQLQIQAPKVEAFTRFISAENVQSMNTVAKTLGIGRNKLFAFLRGKKILMYNNVPFQKFLDAGYFEVKETTFLMNGIEMNKPQTFVTPIGQTWLSKLVQKQN